MTILVVGATGKTGASYPRQTDDGNNKFAKKIMQPILAQRT